MCYKFGPKNPISSLLVILGLLAGSRWEQLHQQFVFDRTATLAVAAVLRDPRLLPTAQVALSELVSEQHWRANWFYGFVARSLGQTTVQETAWATVIRCSDRYWTMLLRIAPGDDSLAQQAVREHPEIADAWFWLAKIRAAKNPEQAIELYRQGLHLDSHDGLRWRELGDLLRPGNPQAAIAAYFQSCRNGDFGYNGCYRAGLVSEQEGDIENAIRYYRLSQWPVAREREAQLELLMQQTR